jgi:hypothetical protein
MLTTIRRAEAVFVAGVLLLGAIAVVRPGNARMLAVATIGIVAVAVALTSALSSRRKKQAFLAGREAISVDDLYEQYYAASGLERESVVRLWKTSADKLGIPAERLRPGDRFDSELAAVDFWESLDDPREDLAAFAATHAKNCGATIDLKQPGTIGELVRQLALIELNASKRAGSPSA